MLKLICTNYHFQCYGKGDGAEIKCYAFMVNSKDCPKKRNKRIMDWECIAEAGI